MARPVRIEFAGAVYHIMARGNERRPIYLDDSDRHRFLQTVAQVVERYGVLIQAYCLMDNHYHLVLETPEPNLALAARHLNGVYGQSFNRRHQRVGHLFQGRYRSQLVGTDKYFLAACRYVVLNPVRAGLCAHPGEWEWSSYRSMVGLSPAPRWLGVEAFLKKVDAEEPARARDSFRCFVLDETGLVEHAGFGAGSSAVSASEQFVRDLAPRFEAVRGDLEHPRRHRLVGRPSLDVIFANVAGKPDRNAKIQRAHIEYGYTMKRIAEFLGVHYATVSRAVKKMS